MNDSEAKNPFLESSKKNTMKYPKNAMPKNSSVIPDNSPNAQSLAFP